MVNAPLVSRPPNPPRSRFAAGLVSAIKWNPHALPAADAIGAAEPVVRALLDPLRNQPLARLHPVKGRPPEAERHIGWLIRLVGRIPRVGPPLESLARAVRMFRHQPLVLGLTSFSTIFVHSLFAVGVYFIACGPPGGHPSLADHLVAMPTSAATQVIPVPIGPLEGTPDNFYARVKVAGPPITPGQGFVVALAYRLVTVLIAVFGLPFYFLNRREMAKVMHEVERPAGGS